MELHPTDKPNYDKKRLLESKGLVIKRKFECKELIIDIPLALDTLEASRRPGNYCIYRVPKRIREVNNMAYTPRLVSIGPFHYHSEELKDMDTKKLLILKNFCNRNEKSIEDLKGIIEHNEETIRSCYSETILLSSDGFLNMIILDAIFILELFRRKYEKAREEDFGSSKAREEDSESSKAREEDSESSNAYKEDSEDSKAHDQIDYILSRPCMERGIQHDLLLLENQLPFFVLENLYQNGDPNTKEPSLRLLACGFFGDLYLSWKPESKKPCFNDLKGWFFCQTKTEKPRKGELLKHITDLDNRFALSPGRSSQSIEVKHFTDLVRYFFCPTNTEEQKLNCLRNHEHLHGTATKLDEAGLKFTKPDSERELLQITFPENKCLERCPWLSLSWLLSCLPCLKSIDCLEHSVQRCLEVPPLRLDDKTEGVFRNLMALEQCHYPTRTYICDYIVLLDDLITTKKDVRLLVEKEIIVNELGSSAAVTKLVNNLALEIEERGTHYAELCGKLNKYYKSPWNRLVGILTRTYFSDFFKGTATVVGIIVLFLTLWNFQRLIRLSTRKY